MPDTVTSRCRCVRRQSGSSKPPPASTRGITSRSPLRAGQSIKLPPGSLHGDPTEPDSATIVRFERGAQAVYFLDDGGNGAELIANDRERLRHSLRSRLPIVSALLPATDRRCAREL